jgi:hypothetical protein
MIVVNLQQISSTLIQTNTVFIDNPRLLLLTVTHKRFVALRVPTNPGFNHPRLIRASASLQTVLPFLMGSEGLVADASWWQVVWDEIAVYLPDPWWIVTLICACLVALSNIATKGRLHTYYSPTSVYWPASAAVFAVLPSLLLTVEWDGYSAEASLWVTNAFQSWCVLACLLVTENIDASEYRKVRTAAIWLCWNSVVAWMPATLLHCRQWSWCAFSMAVGRMTVVFRLLYLVLNQPEIPGLARSVCYLSGMITAMLLQGNPHFTETKAHSTVWQVYSAFTTLVPVCLLVRIHLIHALRRGAIVRFTVRYAPTPVLRWIVEQGGAVNGEGPDEPSALALAVLQRNASAVAILLSAGADVHARCYRRQTPLLCVCPADSYFQELSPAVMSIVKMLLDAGADVNACDSPSQTLLFNISQQPHLDRNEPIIHMLLDAGADALYEHLPYAIHLRNTRDLRLHTADMLMGVIAYQAHLAQHVLPMDELLISKTARIFRKPELLVHAHAAMRRQAWSRRRRAVVARHVQTNELA